MSEQARPSGAPTIAALFVIAAIGVGVVAFTRGQDKEPSSEQPIARGAPIRGAPLTSPAKAPPAPPKPAAEPAPAETPAETPTLEAPKVEAGSAEPAQADDASLTPAAPANEPEKPKPAAPVTQEPTPEPEAVPEIKAPAAKPGADEAAKAAEKPAAKKAPAKEPEKTAAGGPQPIDFEKLAGYTYKTPWGKVTKDMLKKQIPDDILAYSGKNIRVTGYMLPMDIADNGDVRAFFLMKDMASCCFGGTPRMNEWILVNVKKGVTVRYIAYQAINVDGPIEVGEKIENGRLSSLYRLTADAVTPKT